MLSVSGLVFLGSNGFGEKLTFMPSTYSKKGIPQNKHDKFEVIGAALLQDNVLYHEH